MSLRRKTIKPPFCYNTDHIYNDSQHGSNSFIQASKLYHHPIKHTSSNSNLKQNNTQTTMSSDDDDIELKNNDPGDTVFIPSVSNQLSILNQSKRNNQPPSHQHINQNNNHNHNKNNPKPHQRKGSSSNPKSTSNSNKKSKHNQPKPKKPTPKTDPKLFQKQLVIMKQKVLNKRDNIINEHIRNGFSKKMNFTLTRAGYYWNHIIRDTPFHKFIRPFLSFREIKLKEEQKINYIATEIPPIIKLKCPAFIDTLNNNDDVQTLIQNLYFQDKSYNFMKIVPGEY